MKRKEIKELRYWKRYNKKARRFGWPIYQDTKDYSWTFIGDIPYIVENIKNS